MGVPSRSLIAKAPEKLPGPNEKIVFQALHIFQGNFGGVRLHLSRVFFGGNGPIHWRTTCAQAYAEAIFCGRVLTRAFAGSLLSRNAFANALVFNFLKRELPHLHGHIFRFIGTSSSSWAHLPLHGHIFPFMATYSTSLAHLPLHWHIFLFIGTISPSSAHLPLHGYIFL